MGELKALASKVGEVVLMSANSWEEGSQHDPVNAGKLQNDIRAMLESMLHSHMKRLTSGKCTVSAGLVFGDIVTSFDKIADYSCRILEIDWELIHATASGGN